MKRMIVLAALLAGLVPSTAGAQVNPADMEVAVAGLKYLPPVTAVLPDGSVTWRNLEVANIPHNVVALARIRPDGSVDDIPRGICPTMQPGQSCTRAGTRGSQPLEGGVYLYTCTVHLLHTASMQGVLVVQ